LRQGEFDAGAGRPSGSRRGKTRPLEIGEGAAARDIEQDAVDGIAGARTVEIHLLLNVPTPPGILAVTPE
jgi:hypothetical protein